MKIYTKTGDTGKTGVIGGRLEKDHPRVEASGTVDELNSYIGMAIACLDAQQSADMVINQHQVSFNHGFIVPISMTDCINIAEPCENEIIIPFCT